MKNERIFLAKELNNNDRDIVKYLEFNGFECGHYFSGLHIVGACFSGFEKEFREKVKTDYENIETILTKEELEQMFELNDELKELGYGIKKNSVKYNKGMEIIKKFENTIGKKLLSDENKKLFEKVVVDEKEYVKNEYNLTDEEVDEVFDNYELEYQDRAIICTIFDNFYDMVYEEKISFGYNNQPYFNNKSFGKDLLSIRDYYKLKNGKIVYYSY